MTGLLSDGEIQARAERDELIVSETFKPDSLQPASYDLTIAADGMITPDGKEIAPGLKGWGRRPLVLQAGDTALFSSFERLSMPDDVAGNITIRNTLANQGLTLLSGMLVDPGFGRKSGVKGQLGCCLYLHVANIGKAPIPLRPGVDTIARVQFLNVVGAVSKRRTGVEPSLWADQRQASLGFLTEMRNLKRRFERSDARSEVVVVFGVVVLAVALIGASFSSILSIVTNSLLRRELRNAWPSGTSDKILWAAIFVSVTALVGIVAWSTRETLRGLAARRRRRERRNRA